MGKNLSHGLLGMSAAEAQAAQAAATGEMVGAAMGKDYSTVHNSVETAKAARDAMQNGKKGH
jgi:hypothetical protein